MSPPARRLWRTVLMTAALATLAALLLPLVRVNRFRSGIRQALEESLGRKVEIGEVTLSLLPAPGFELHNVVIGDDPRFGEEHFAYMSSMQVRPRVRTLWKGRVQVASITLVEPSINLVKNGEGRWNFEALLVRAGQHAASSVTGASSAGTYSPYIGIDSGRLNFKFGQTKALFYIQDVDAALAPLRDSDGRWHVRFSGLPSRTDRLLNGMGRLTGEGEWMAASPGKVAVRLDLALANSPMAHLFTLFYGRDFGVHGELGAQAQLAGESGAMAVKGILQVNDVHRWDQGPVAGGSVAIPFQGEWDVTRQHLLLETNVPSGPPGSVHVSLELRDYLSAPDWQASVGLEQAPVAPFVRLAEHLGGPAIAPAEVRGLVSGQVVLPGTLAPHGVLHFDGMSLLFPGSPALTLSPAEATLDGETFSIPTTDAKIGKETLHLAVAGNLNPLSLTARLSSRDLHLAAVRGAAEYFHIVRLGSLMAGQWDGDFNYRKTPGVRGVWTGTGTLRQALWQPPDLESPVAISQARVRWDASGATFDSLAGRLGPTAFIGSYHRRFALPEPDTGKDSVAASDRCTLRVDSVDLGALDEWLNPRKEASRWAVWMRALGRGAAKTPSWLQSARLEGQITIGSLQLGAWPLRNVRSALSWTGQELALKGLQGELFGGTASGALVAAFGGSVPRYQFEAFVSGLDLRGLAGSSALAANFRRGSLDLRISFETEGRTRDELRAALKAAGAFEGRGISLENMERQDAEAEPGSALEIRSLRGRFEMARDSVQLTGLRLTVGRETYQGRGAIGGQPAVWLDLSATDGKPLRLVAAAAREAAAVP